MSEYLLHKNMWIALSDWNTGILEGLAMTIDVVVCVTQTFVSTTC